MVEFAARQGRRYRDLPDLGPAENRRLDHAGDRVCLEAERLELVELGDIVLEAQLQVLARVRDRAAAHRHDQVGISGARHRRGSQHGVARDMGRDVVVDGGEIRAQRIAQLVDLVGLVVERVAYQQEYPLGAEPLHLLQDDVDKRPTEKYALHRRNAE